MPEVTNGVEWLVGLAQKLEEDGQQDAAGVVRTMIGSDGQGGVLKSLFDYNSENTLQLPSEYNLDVEVDMGNGPIPATVKVKVQSPIIHGILVGTLISAWLSTA